MINLADDRNHPAYPGAIIEVEEALGDATIYKELTSPGLTKREFAAIAIHAAVIASADGRLHSLDTEARAALALIEADALLDALEKDQP